jgi:tight adherence protein B
VSGWGLVALITGAAATFLVAYVILEVLFGRSPEQRRIASLKVFTAKEPKKNEPATRQILAPGGRLIESSPALAAFAARSETLLEQHAAAPKPAEWLWLRLCVAFGAAVLLTVLLPAWLGLPVGLLLGFHLPPLVLRLQIRRRRQQFADDLPNVLQLVLSSLRSGFTLQQAVEAAVRDDEGPVAEQLSQALSEARISGEFEDALERVGERVGSSEMLWLVMALRLQREVGGSLAEVMQTTADTMRERAYLRRQVRTLSAEGRMSAYVLMALPLMTGVALVIMRPGYVRPLYTEPIGLLMLLVAALLMAVGVIWLRAAVKIEA